MHSSEDELGIDEDIRAEQQCAHPRVRQLDPAVVWEEHGDEAKQDHEPECAVEIAVPATEVVFSLESKEREAGEHGAGDDDGLEHDPGIVETRDYRDGVCLDESEAGEED